MIITKIHKLIQESEFKLRMLPSEYFVEYFEKDFLLQLKAIKEDVLKNQKNNNKMKKILELITKKCNELADTYQVAIFQDEIKDIINERKIES